MPVYTIVYKFADRTVEKNENSVEDRMTARKCWKLMGQAHVDPKPKNHSSPL